MQNIACHCCHCFKSYFFHQKTPLDYAAREGHTPTVESIKVMMGWVQETSYEGRLVKLWIFCLHFLHFTIWNVNKCFKLTTELYSLEVFFKQLIPYFTVFWKVGHSFFFQLFFVSSYPWSHCKGSPTSSVALKSPITVFVANALRDTIQKRMRLYIL